MQKENSAAASIAIAENELIALAADLKISDKLAVERTVLAADRTMNSTSGPTAWARP